MALRAIALLVNGVKEAYNSNPAVTHPSSISLVVV